MRWILSYLGGYKEEEEALSVMHVHLCVVIVLGLDYILPSTCTLSEESARNQAKESARPSEGLSVYADSSDTEEVSGRGWATLLEHWQPSTPSTLGMKNDVGLAKESAFMLIVLLLILRKFLVVAGNTDKTIRWPIAIISRDGNLML